MEYITVHHFYDTTELTLVKNHLEHAGISTRTRDEQTMQTLSMLEARAIGGAKLQVPKSDYVRASQLLIELGVMTANEDPQDFWIINFLDSMACAIPGLGSLSKELRLVVIGFIIIAIPFSIAVLMNLP